MDTLAQLVLPKPPRLLASGDGYDWREFDRWLQRLFILLGTPNSNNNEINVFQQLLNLQAETDSSFVVDHQQEIRNLQSKIDDLALEVNSLIVGDDRIPAIIQRVDNLAVEIDALANQEQMLRRLKELIESLQVETAMEV